VEKKGTSFTGERLGDIIQYCSENPDAKDRDQWVDGVYLYVLKQINKDEKHTSPTDDPNATAAAGSTQQPVATAAASSRRMATGAACIF
jgi:hypothetical protein